MATLKEFRAQYPQYNDMSDAALASSIHRKFYPDMPETEFQAKIGLGSPAAGASVDQPTTTTATADQPPAPASPPPSGVNPVVGAVAHGLQGFTLGGSDEALAAIQALDRAGTNVFQGKAPELGSNYDAALAEQRGILKGFQAEHPNVALAANVAGGLATAGPAAGVIKGAGSALGGLGRSIGTGLGYGALGGFLSGEGPTTSEGLQNRAAGALEGAQIGGILGAAAPVVIGGTGRAINLGRNMIGAANPRTTALDILDRGLTRDAADPAAVQAALTASDKPLSIMDVAGENTQRAGKMAITQPGPGAKTMKDFLHGRQLEMTDRIGSDIEQKLSGDNFKASMDALDEARKTDAAPLYEKAYAKDFVWNDKIENILARPAANKALQRAYTLAGNEGRDPRGIGITLNNDGKAVIDHTDASFQTLDYVKRGLDVLIERRRDPVTGRLKMDDELRGVLNTQKELVTAMDRLNSDYKAARQAWGGPSQTMDAMRLGRRFANGDHEVTVDRFNELSPGDQTAFRIGMARQLKETVSNVATGTNAARRIMGSKGQQERLRALFPDEASYAAFEKSINEEKAMNTTLRQLTGGSDTARNVSDMGDAADMGQVATDFVKGGLTGALSGFAARSANRLGRGINEKSAAELASMLATADRATQTKVIDELVKRRARTMALGNAAATATALGGAGMGGILARGRDLSGTR